MMIIRLLKYLASRRSRASACALVTLTAVLGTVPATRAADTEILSFTPEACCGPGNYVLRARVPSNSVVQLHGRANLATNADWIDFGAPVFVLNREEVEFYVPYVPEPNSFFRLSAASAQISLTDDGSQFHLQTTNPVPLGLILQAAGGTAGTEVFLVGTNCDPFALVDPIDTTAIDLEGLFRQLGCTVRVAPPPGDTTNSTSRFALDSSLQNDPLPETPGVGLLEDGHPGDSGFPDAGVGDLDPEPLPTHDKGLVQEIPPGPDTGGPEDDPTLVEPGRHLRVKVTLQHDGGVTLTRAFENTGDARLAWPTMPLEDDTVVCVVRSPLHTNDPAGIYFINALADPFEIRSYDPPPEGRTHFGHQESIALRLPIPLLPEDTDLSGLLVEFHRVLANPDGEMLDATAFDRHPELFQSLGQITGDELALLLRSGGGRRVAQAPSNATLHTLYRGGSMASKYNLVFVADGFDDSAFDQQRFSNWVQTVALENVFGRDIGPEIMNAMNIFRIDTDSVDSGITLSDPNNVVTNAKNTALDFRYNGTWGKCWIDVGPNGQQRLDDIIDELLPQADGIAVVLNRLANGGCASGILVRLPLGTTFADNWGTLAHEFGHSFGKQGDEYSCGFGESLTNSACITYTDPEPSAGNLTTNRYRKFLKWGEWVPPWRPLPTPKDKVADMIQDVGAFQGATKSASK